MSKFYKSINDNSELVYVFEHKDIEVSDPFRSECSRFTVEPSYYGLTINQAHELVELNRQLKLKIESDNMQFESQMLTVCYSYLKDEIDLKMYVKSTLDEMFYGGVYSDNSGNLYNHEIAPRYTYNGLPVVVSLTEKV
jgi:hypothetical protein